MRILLADDHALVRRGLIELLGSAEQDWTFEEAGSFPELEGKLQGDAFDMVIADLHMPGMQGATSLRAIRSSAPGARVMVLTAQDDRETILECLGAGVHGYLPKSGDANQILDALRIVVAGGMYVPPSLSVIASPAAAMAGGNADHGHHRSDAPDHSSLARDGARRDEHGRDVAASAGANTDSLRLSGRQQQVLKLLAEGRSTKDIARLLDLGIGTVKVHLAAIYRTLGARNRMEAIVKAGVISR